MSNSRAFFFNRNSKYHRNNASRLIGRQFDMSTSPYSSLGYHASSAIHPLCYAAKTIGNAIRIIKGGFLLLGALFDDPIESIPNVIGGAFNEATSMMLNIINCAASIVLFFTRTLSTLFSFLNNSNKASNFLDDSLYKETVNMSF